MVRLICFLSGAAALAFESVWFHRAGLVFGNSVWSTSLVLSSFMGGLTLGSALIGLKGSGTRTPLDRYARVEATVAISGVALTLALPALTQLVVSLTHWGSDREWVTNLTRFATAFLVLLVPSTAMGASLPLLVGAVDDIRPESGATPVDRRAVFDDALGSAYGLNTLGAVAGVVSAEAWLIGAFGIVGTAWFAAALSGMATLMAMAKARAGSRAHRPTTGADTGALLPLMPLLASSFLAGAALLALEVVWFRFLTLFVLSTTQAASVMLATVLSGIALGGFAAGRWSAAKSAAIDYIPAVGFACGALVIGSYASFDRLTSGTQIATWPRTLWLACALMLPASACSGVLFTMTGAAVQRVVTTGTRAVGWLSVANTAGGMCGSLVAAFALLPRVGTEGAFAALAASYLAVGALSTWGLGWRRVTRRSWFGGPTGAAAAALVGALVFFPSGSMRDVHFARVAQPYAVDGSTVTAIREGPSETIFLMQQPWLGEPVYTRLVTNGFSMSGTSVPALRYMRYFAYWPAALHRGPLKRALVICLGVGVTASAVLDLPSVEVLDIAEISQDVVSTTHLIDPSGQSLKDPRVRLHVEDGRQFLQHTEDRFDLITGEPPPPRTPGAVNIYTREYFQLMHDRLADNGIATYWLPVGRPDPGTNVTPIMRAFCDVFADCSLWNATPFDLMLVGSRAPDFQGRVGTAPTEQQAAGPLSEDDFVKPWTVPALRAKLTEIGFELPQQLGATFLGDAEYLRELTSHSPTLDDNHPQRLRPSSEHPSLSDPGYGTDERVTRLYRSVMDPRRAREAFERSAFIRALWPQRVLDATLPYFEHQNTLNQVLFEGGRALGRIETLHAMLRTTPLRTLPLWVLGSDDVKAGIAARRDDGTGAAPYARGLTALATRDYLGASAAFAEADARGLRDETVLALRVYSLWAAGRGDEAKVLVATAAPPRTEDERVFFRWIRERLAGT